MKRYIKFTVGNVATGYKTIELVISGGKVSYKILRSGLLNVAKKDATAQMSDEWLAKLDALNILAWEENYSSEARGGVQWQLDFKSGKKFYNGRGSNAYPEVWERFLDWLDALIPELEFINRRRFERVTLSCFEETLTLDRRDGTFTIAKKNSRHVYDLGANAKKIFDTCQNLLDGIEIEDVDLSFGSCVQIEVLRHDSTTDTFETLYNENFLPGLASFIELIRDMASDLTAKLFTPDTAQVVNSDGKIILCKVQFTGSYKLYTYRTEDETLAVNDVVDVPVGKNNDVAQARLVEIGYFDEYETPIPLEKIKAIIGKHVANDWENY